MHILLFAALPFVACVAFAQEKDGTTEQIYQKYKAAETRSGLELRNAFNGIPFPKDGGQVVDEQMRLEKVLEKRALDRDGLALFYLGVIANNSGLALRSVKSARYNDDFDKAVDYFKQACTLKIFNGCSNVAIMYLHGDGSTKSGSAAAEWYYKAGAGLHSAGMRDQALAALDSINQIDPNHPLGKRLGFLLQKDAPK